jgi:pimeloyl-ACP methyl ester carboxylesterase
MIDPTRSDATARAMRAPSALLMMLEARAPWEMAAGWAAAPWLSRLHAGDGHPVIVYPGLGASARSTALLRRFLADCGYTPYDWALGTNRGPHSGMLEDCAQRLDTIARRHNSKVSLIGWSLGGLYAREIAKRATAQTRCVVTLGSPFSGDPGANNAAQLYRRLSGRSPNNDPVRRAELRRAPSVPTTSIYSRSDGVVAWQCSLNDEAAHTENIEIPSSHIGMGAHPMALHAIGDRLRQDPANWQRFDRGLLRGWMPRAASA